MCKSFLTKIFLALVCLFSTIIFGRVEDINAEDDYWGYEYTGVQEMVEMLNSSNDQLEEMVVAVLDTGVDSNHEWIEGRIVSGGINCLDKRGCRSGGYEDDHGHGTHVAGIIAKSTPKNVQILPIKVLDSRNSGWIDDFVAGLNYVVELKKSGVNIVAVNFSISSSSKYEGNEEWHNKYRDAFEMVRNEEILAVVCAGNNKVDVAKIVGPSNIENVIAVSSISKKINDDGDVQFSFSEEFSNFGETIDLSAPGEKIISAKLGGGITQMSGTSMSTPYVTASVALLYSICPNCSMEQVEDALMEGAVDLGEVGKDSKYGHGALNVINSYNYLKSVVNYKIKAMTEGCGTVNVGQENVHLGGKAEALLVPFNGCEVEKVLVNGEELDESAMDDAILNGYTFFDVKEDNVIQVIFVKKTYVVESVVQGNGRASIVGTQMVKHGESLTVKFTPRVGYKVSKILVNGRALSGAELNNAIANGYTFDNINENKTIKVIFDVKTYVVTSVVGGKGSVNIVGNTTVTYGSSLKITFKPQVGYKVSKVIINGKELSGTRLNNIISKGYHVFSSIKQNCSIRIVFVKILPSINSSAVAVCF